MNVSITKAAQLSGVSRTTLYTDMNSGKLTFQIKGKNKKTIDVSELERVYGSLNIVDTPKVTNNVKAAQSNFTNTEQPLTELAVLRERISLFEKHSEQMTEQYESRIENLEGSLSKAQDGYNNVTKLLEDKSSQDSGAGEWGKSLKALENRISNQEKTAKETAEKEQKIIRQNRALKKALDEERNKSFFKKLFG